VKPWLASASNYKEINAAEALKDPDSVFRFYQKLIRMRKEMPVVQEGLFVPMMEDHDKVFAYERKLNDESLICFSNFYADETEIDLASEGYGILLSNYQDTVLKDHMVLRPYESVIIYKKN
jgi:trehalose-6-phosphate hydrolase